MLYHVHIAIFFHISYNPVSTPAPGGTDLERVYGDGALKTSFSRLSCSSQGSHFKQKSQFTLPPFQKIGNFSLYSLNFHPNFSSQAPKFGNFQLTSPQIWKFSAHKSPNLEIFAHKPPKFWNFQITNPPFQRRMSVREPHTSEIRAAHPSLKKNECPPSRIHPQHKPEQILFKLGLCFIKIHKL